VIPVHERMLLIKNCENYGGIVLLNSGHETYFSIIKNKAKNINMINVREPSGCHKEDLVVMDILLQNS
jgi:hypothetical protein